MVAAARDPAFYRDWGVADSIEGRYEMIVLHLVLLLRRLRLEGGGPAAPKTGALAQAVMDFMAADLDRSMRELGIGDLSVGRYMKRLGEGLYGRAATYDAALDAHDSAALSDALVRNVYAGRDPGGRNLAMIAAYALSQPSFLAGQPIADIMLGRVAFISPAG